MPPNRVFGRRKTESSRQINKALTTRRLSLQVIPREKMRPRNRCSWDEYCWVCHYKTTTLFCTTCIRSYHIGCVPNGKKIADILNYSCQLCADMKQAKQERAFKRPELNNLLKFLVKRLWYDLDFGNLRKSFNSKNILNPIDLEIVNEKVNDGLYWSLIEFMGDILWIQHNCRIIKGDNIETKKMLKRLTDFCMQELYDIDVCSECYRNANINEADWFSVVCQVPHILVWARIAGDRSYFPAKAMALKKVHSKKLIHVQFFGSSNRNAFVQPSKCFLFSKKSPSGVTFDESQAPSDLRRYIRGMARTFNVFYQTEKAVQFDHKKIYDQLLLMLPDCKLARSHIDKSFKQQPFTMNVSAGRRHRLNPEYLPDLLQKAMYQPRVVLERISDQDTNGDGIVVDSNEIVEMEAVEGNIVVAADEDRNGGANEICEMETVGGNSISANCEFIANSICDNEVISVSSYDSDDDSKSSSLSEATVILVTTNSLPTTSPTPISSLPIPNAIAAAEATALDSNNRQMLLDKISENFKTQEQLIVECNYLRTVIQTNQKRLEENATDMKNLQDKLDAAEESNKNLQCAIDAVEESNTELKKDIEHMKLDHAKKIKIIKLDMALEFQAKASKKEEEYEQKIKDAESKVRKEAELERKRVLDDIENAFKQARRSS